MIERLVEAINNGTGIAFTADELVELFNDIEAIRGTGPAPVLRIVFRRQQAEEDQQEEG